MFCRKAYVSTWSIQRESLNRIVHITSMKYFIIIINNTGLSRTKRHWIIRNIELSVKYGGISSCHKLHTKKNVECTTQYRFLNDHYTVQLIWLSQEMIKFFKIPKVFVSIWPFFFWAKKLCHLLSPDLVIGEFIPSGQKTDTKQKAVFWMTISSLSIL